MEKENTENNEAKKEKIENGKERVQRKKRLLQEEKEGGPTVSAMI